jgi:hypothetical protein
MSIFLFGWADLISNKKLGGKLPGIGKTYIKMLN